MSHTMLEQKHEFGGVDTAADEMNNIFDEQFGYTKNGDYRYSPVDPNFGVRWLLNGTDNDLRCNLTFDGGSTFVTLCDIMTTKQLIQVCYHVSKNEKVIYLRIRYNSYSSYDHRRDCEIIIAHDDTDNTVCFIAPTIKNSYDDPGYLFYSIDKDKTRYTVDEVKNASYKVRPNMPNAVYRYPSMKNYSMFSELFAIINVQAYSSLSDMFISFNGQIYRVVGCFDNHFASTSFIPRPYFAFPVSD